MTTCVLVLGAISCVIDPSARITPAEAAAILTPNQTAVSSSTTTPRVIYIESSLTPERRPEELERPARRLDGTLLTDPPVNYGMPLWLALRGTSERSRVRPRFETSHAPYKK